MVTQKYTAIIRSTSSSVHGLSAVCLFITRRCSIKTAKRVGHPKNDGQESMSSSFLRQDKDLVEIRTCLLQQGRQIQLGRTTFAIFEKASRYIPKRCNRSR